MTTNSPLRREISGRGNRLAEIARKNYTNRDIDDEDEEEVSSPYSINTGGGDHWGQSVDYRTKYSKPSPMAGSLAKNNAQNSFNKTTTDDILKMLDDEFPEELSQTAPAGSIKPRVLATSASQPNSVTKSGSTRGRGPPKDDTEEVDSLAKERAELKRMMEELQQEKMKVMNNNNYESRKKRENDEEAKMAIKERDELRTALATLRAKNTWLAKTMESTEKEAEQKIQEERETLQKAMQEMEAQNRHLTKQVLDAQDAAERALAAEKLEFRNALKVMEAEKLELAQRVLKTENEARREAEEVKKQKEEVERRVQEMKNEREDILRKVQENEEQAKHASAAMAEKLSKEHEELAAHMKRMEEEKMSLASNLSAMEQSAAEHAKSLEAQLQQERASLQEALEKMEKDKESLSNSLTEAEKLAQEQANKVAEQLAKEKEAMLETVRAMEREKTELADRLSHNEKAVDEKVVNLSTAAEQLAKEKQALADQMEKMKRERMELQSQIEEAAAQKAAQEKEKEARLAMERDELREAVLRMQSEMELEKKQQEMLFSAAFEDVDESTNNGPNLTPKRSLADLLAEEGTNNINNSARRVPSTSKLPKVMSRQMNTIKEEDEEAAAAEKASAKLKSQKSQKSQVPPNLDLPPAHIAAAKGDMDQLKHFSEMQPTILSSHDASGRSPLFYAVAYDQHEAASYLVHMSPDSVIETDIHGDSPLHAAASGGSARCIELLVRHSRSIGQPLVNPCNKMEMTPAHLAKNVSSMEALFANGASFTVRDSSLRSPLFIAAAMNRSDCVQYIIDNCLEGNDDELYSSDVRGDTPLHAASCNGAADCVLLLLQCGINPLSLNKAGLRAIDLAQRNKKMKCREILAQYHLHFATASDFDSVGFIATLEGHKQLKSSVKGGAYDIIKKGGGADGGESTKGMKKVQSLFSLRMDQSIRLQRYGSWIVYHDDANNSTYYYNQTSRTGQWEIPDRIKHIQTQALHNNSGASTSMDGFGKGLQTKLSMRLKKVGDWIQYSTGAGRIFYYNDKNGDFKWVTPEIDTSVASAKHSDLPFSPNTQHQDSGSPFKKQSNSSSATTSAKAPQVAAAAHEEMPAELSEWRAYKDPGTGAMFWYNEVTKVSQWECPDEKYRTAPPVEDIQHEQDVVVVQSDEDLGLY